jgi:hypothetical protein
VGARHSLLNLTSLLAALNLTSLLAAVEAASRSGRSMCSAAALAEAIDAREVSFLIAEFSGLSLIRLGQSGGDWRPSPRRDFGSKTAKGRPIPAPRPRVRPSRRLRRRRLLIRDGPFLAGRWSVSGGRAGGRSRSRAGCS